MNLVSLIVAASLIVAGSLGPMLSYSKN